MDSSFVKISQRPAKSCTECIRRKTRCNKQIPCDLCSKRGVSHLCRLESNYVPVPSPSPLSEIDALRQGVYAEIEVLRRRIVELEKASGRRSESRNRTDGGGGGEETDAATTLEFFALGLDRRLGGEDDAVPPIARQPRQIHSHILPDPLPTPPERVTDSLLPRHIVTPILEFHQQGVYWQHACIYFPRFWEEVAVFYNAVDNGGWGRVDGTWTALFFVLQAIAVHQMTDENAVACGLNEADRFVLPTALIDSAMAAFNHGNFLSRPTIYSCQAIAILALCGHNVCESDLLSSLLAIGIKLAQTLNLHSLGRAREKSVIDWELGKRVWWSLTMEDWFAIPFRGVWSVQPDHFDTPLPSNCHDSDLASGHNPTRPESEATVGLCRLHFKALFTVCATDLHRPSESADKIRHLITLLPQPSPAQPPWTSNMRHYLLISASHKILTIYRAFLARGGTLAERSKAQTECVKAAEAIIEEMNTQSGSQALWTIPYHTLAAGVVLALEMIASKGKKDGTEARRRDYVAKAMWALERLSPTSRIARRGLQVLTDLMREVEANGKRRRGSEDMAKMVKKIRLPDDVLPESSPSTPVAPTPSVDSTLIPDPISGSGSNGVNFSPGMFEWSQQETNALLASLQEAIPDVGRLFDGSLGSFGWGEHTFGPGLGPS
ncbi:hypothetical protein IAR55_002631 [Kwoniella newhampshirensis]|uniref:Zn(2)-C6 fungal-type domain-containing protein n=1 Tax=Kwoniella newhampshirensis TaxID=1651941 RepID=A0AAW0YZ58_9TREE